MKNKEKMLLLFWILLLVDTTYGMAAHQTEPSLLMTKVENYVFVKFDFQITCKTSAPVKKCYFQFENSIINVPDGFSGIANFSYVGAGFENGECGIDLDAKWDMEGNVSCGVQLEENGQNLTAHGKIFVDSAIGASVLESNCKITDLLQCNEGQPMQISCRAKAGKYSEAELILGNETLNTAKGSKWANSTIRIAKFSDNGKLVVCNVTHPARSYITQKPLEILFAPRPVEELKDGILYLPNSFIPGRNESIRIRIAANPKLSAVHWTVNGKEADGKKYQPLSINQSTFSEPHWWEVGVDVDPFTEDDLQTTFQLHLTNEVGTTEVLVQIHQESSFWVTAFTVILAGIIAFIVANIIGPIFEYRKFIRRRQLDTAGWPLLKKIFWFLGYKILDYKKCPTSSVHKDELKRALAEEVVNWSEDFNFADAECLQDLCKHSANSDSNDLGEWHLVKHVKSRVVFQTVFEGKLFFNAAKRQLVVVCIDPWKVCEIMRKSNFLYFFIYAAVKFGDKVRLLVNNFKVEPLVLATGQVGGGYLAQVLTFSMKNLQVEDGEIVRLEEKGVHCHTVTFDAPPSFRAIEDLAKDPLDQDALRLAITNHISDQQLVDCCSSDGPHVGRVFFYKKQQQDEEQPLQRKQLLSNVGSSNLDFARFDLEDVNEVKSFVDAKQEESNGAIPWFFFDKSEWDLLKIEENKQESERNKQIPPFQFNNNTSFVESEVAETVFVARVRLFSRVNFSSM